MKWFGYFFIAAIIGAVVLALYERRKNKRLTYDDSNLPPHDRGRAAFTAPEQIRAEEEALYRPGGSTPL